MSFDRAIAKAFHRWFGSRTPIPVGQRRGVSFNSRVMKVINKTTDTKFGDVAYANTTAVDGTSVVYHVTGVAEGDTESSREGQHIRLGSLQVVGQIQGDPNVTEDTTARFIIFRWNMDARGALPSVTALMANDSVTSLKDWQNASEFKIYYDKTFLLPMRAVVASIVIPKKSFKFYKSFTGKGKKAGLNVTFSGSGSAIGDAEKGHFFILMMTDQANTYQPQWTWNCRITWKD